MQIRFRPKNLMSRESFTCKNKPFGRSQRISHEFTPESTNFDSCIIYTKRESTSWKKLATKKSNISANETKK